MKGIILMVSTYVIFFLTGLYTKYQYKSTNISPIIDIFFRFVIYTILSYLLSKYEKKSILDIRKELRKWLFFRVFFGSIGFFLYFASFDFISISDTNILNNTIPFWTIIFSYLVLKEKVTKYDIVSIIFGFVGVLILIKPDFIFGKNEENDGE